MYALIPDTIPPAMMDTLRKAGGSIEEKIVNDYYVRLPKGWTFDETGAPRIKIHYHKQLEFAMT